MDRRYSLSSRNYTRIPSDHAGPSNAGATIANQPRPSFSSQVRTARQRIMDWANWIEINGYMDPQARVKKEARQIREHNCHVQEEREMYMLQLQYNYLDFWGMVPQTRNFFLHAHGESTIVWARQHRAGKSTPDSEASGNEGPGEKAIGKRKLCGSTANNNKVGESSRSQITRPNNDDNDDDEGENATGSRAMEAQTDEVEFDEDDLDELGFHELTRVSRHIPSPDDPGYESEGEASIWARRICESQAVDPDSEYDADWERNSDSTTSQCYCLWCSYSEEDEENGEDEEEDDLESHSSSSTYTNLSCPSLTYSGDSSSGSLESTESTDRSSVFSPSSSDSSSSTVSSV